MSYLIMNGYEIEIIEVSADTFTPARPGPTRAATLDSARDILGTILSNDNTGDGLPANQLAALLAIWEPGSETDIALLATRGYIKSTSALISVPIDDMSGSPTGKRLHQTSYKNVLPPRFSEAWHTLTRDNESANVTIEKNRSVIKAIEGSFENIKSHATADEAWAAYNDFVIRGQGDEAAAEARANYLVKA